MVVKFSTCSHYALVFPSVALRPSTDKSKPLTVSFTLHLISFLVSENNCNDCEYSIQFNELLGKPQIYNYSTENVTRAHQWAIIIHTIELVRMNMERKYCTYSSCIMLHL